MNSFLSSVMLIVLKPAQWYQNLLFFLHACPEFYFLKNHGCYLYRWQKTSRDVKTLNAARHSSAERPYCVHLHIFSRSDCHQRRQHVPVWLCQLEWNHTGLMPSLSALCVCLEGLTCATHGFLASGAQWGREDQVNRDTHKRWSRVWWPGRPPVQLAAALLKEHRHKERLRIESGPSGAHSFLSLPPFCLEATHTSSARPVPLAASLPPL